MTTYGRYSGSPHLRDYPSLLALLNGTQKRHPTGHPFGSDVYSREELVAEFGAAFLCATAGIDNTLDNSAAYIAGWSKALRADKRLVITAARKGQKAADYITES